jgi:membrane associated rhomboid family serine protease
VALIAINVLAFLGQLSIGTENIALMNFAVVPNELFLAGMGGIYPADATMAIAIPEPATLISYMFLHGDWLHLISNMLFLWVFGDNVEDAMGHARFLVFYLACGVLAAMTHALIMPDSGDALIGASGAVSGVVSAYLILHPKVSVWVLALKFIPLRISAAFVLGFWILTQLVMVMMPEVGPVAWWAHIGGLIAGAVLLPFFRRPGVALFGG